MKPYLHFVAALVYCAPLAAHCQSLRFPRLRIPVVTPLDSDSVTEAFPFSNAGNRAVRVVTVSASCGCTTAVGPKNPVQPGESRAIEVKYSTAGKAGRRYASIVVLTDEPDHNRYSLQLEVEIRRTVTVEPSFLAWNIARPMHPQTVEIVGHTGTPIRLKRMNIDNPIAVLSAGPEDSADHLRLLVTPAGGKIAGVAVVTLEVRLAGGEQRTEKLYLHAF